MGDVGRPTDYKEEYNRYVYFLCLYGISEERIAWFFGISKETLYSWIRNIDSFKLSILKSMEDYPNHIKQVEAKKHKRREYRKESHIRKHANEYLKHRVKTDTRTRVRFNFSSLLRSRLKSKKGTFSAVGYSVDDLIKHLEKQFKSKMTWNNYGKIWHIDHIIPDSWFKYKSQYCDGFKQSWALTNLQPLLVQDNLNKGNRYAG